MDRYNSAKHVADALSPSDPVICLRPHAAWRAANAFVTNFPGKVFYAVKSNPDPRIVQAIADGGVTHFDVASLVEIRSVRAQLPTATLAFMNPVKPAEAIAEAYHQHGVRIFSLDSEAELHKILVATDHARDLTLCVRMSVDNSHAKLSLGRKFGIAGDAAAALLRRTRLVAQRLGVCFHVGSQTMSPAAYVSALDAVEQLVVQSRVTVDVVDVGGGFPSAYPGMQPPALGLFFSEIGRRFESFLSTESSELWCEPGRALCAESASVLVRVDGRKDQDLFINDGVYGTLFDAGHLGWRYPTQVIGKAGGATPFRFYGPTCDDADMMPGPFFLPAETRVGDFIEIGMTGAYGRAMAGTFNGFGQYVEVECADDPFGTLYGDLGVDVGRAVASR